MRRLLSSVDPKSGWITFMGVYQCLFLFILIYGIVAMFPPDFAVWWNLPVPKGARVGIGGYSLIVALGVLATWHTYGMLFRNRWAVLAAGFPYLAIAIWRAQSLVEFLLTHSIEWDMESTLDVMTSCSMIGIYVFVYLAALRILADILENRRKSSVDVQVA